MALRAYQTDIIARYEAEVAAGRRRVLMVAPTGAGKTVIAGAIIERAVAARQKVLFFAHRRELIFQASKRLHEQGIEHGIILPQHSPQPTMPVQVASIQTLHARAMRTDCMRLPPADLVICDEAHHARAESYQKLLAAYPAATLLGLTATPCRADGRGLGNIFAVLIECPGVSALIAAGHLVGTRVYAPSTPDLAGVRTARGDYVERDLAQRVDTDLLVGDILEHWLRLAGRRPTVVFATGVAHSMHIRNEFRRAGVLAEHIDGTTPKDERDAILAKHSAGQVEVVVNAMVLTEGWDQPCVQCVVLARPTKSLGLYRQIIGRGLRIHPGKEHLLVLDHAGATRMHGFAEDSITWNLDVDQLAVNKVHAARAATADRASLMTNCPECHAVMLRSKPCGACGWAPKPKPDSFDFADGQLVAITPNGSREVVFTDAQKASFYQQMLWIGKERGYKPGWASVQHKERFGHWPNFPHNSQPPPEPASPAVIAWVRQKTIQWLRSQPGRIRPVR